MKRWKKNRKSDFFALNTLNKANCLVCGQIIKKKRKCEYSLKRHYRTCHTKFHSLMDCEDSVLAT